MPKVVMGLAGVAVLVMASAGAAQTPAAPDHSHEQSAQTPMMTPEMMRMMCSQMSQHAGGAMMGGAMGGTMGGTMGGMMGTSDPKAQARLLRFRADMMKAMSEVMLKHAAELEKEQ